MVLETSVSFIHLTRLIAGEDLIEINSADIRLYYYREFVFAISQTQLASGELVSVSSKPSSPNNV
jgi:hypothetical protein